MIRVILLISFFISIAANGQLAAPQFSMPISIAAPANEFSQKNTGSDAFFGLGGEFNFPVMHDSPLRVGLSFRNYWMGNRSRDLEVTDSIGTYDVYTRVRGLMMPLHVFARFDPMHLYDSPVMPYAGGFIGARFFNVGTIVEIDWRDGTEPEEDRFINGTTTLSFGFQVGVHIRLSEFMLLDLRWERAYGSEATYLDIASIEIDDEGYGSYEILETRTDVDLFTIGLVIEFRESAVTRAMSLTNQ